MPAWRNSAPLASLAPLIALTGFLIVRTLPGVSFWRDGVIALQVAFVAWSLSGRLTGWSRLLLMMVTAGGTFVVLSANHVPAASVGFALGGVCHLFAYSALLTWFALSLRPGCEPVVTSFARQMRKTMPAEVLRYTRSVTAAWCAFFAAQLLVSLLLAATASYATWSAFVNVWNLPLVAIMALGEYGVRMRLFARNERTGLLATLAALGRIRVLPGRPS